jgi:hypothetical protein
MGRGRAFAGHKIVPPKGARWAPKPNGRAKCMGHNMRSASDKRAPGLGKSFADADIACKKVTGSTYTIPGR